MRWRGRCGLVVVALVLVMASVAASAGSQTFVNDTGQAATGIVITFSTQALITWNDGKLHEQTPDGMSDSFTFSGGSIEPGAGLMISWGPDSASVVDYQWLTKEETTATPPENSPAVDNNLPGPDEPLYQPQTDEQVWLTDAEGHGVIYDNDSIKLNFAPSFDQSQIERIVWYRNGIRMRFVNPEDKVQLLTNALMKTFDGNPLEHSPASAHTDHAIAGYDYKVEIHLKDGGLKLLETTVESTFKWHPEVYAQMDSNWTISLSRLNYNDLIEFLKILKHDGFTGVALDMSYYMNTPHDIAPYKLETRDPQIAAWNMRSPKVEELETILKAIEQVGLEAHVRGNIYVSKEYQDKYGFSGNGYLEPRNPSKFFDNYTNLWLGIVPILNKYHAKLITPFVECDKLEKYSDLIQKMYTRLSKTFHGELGFDEATNVMLSGDSTINSTPIKTASDFARLVGNFDFWDWQDSQGRPMILEYSGWIIAAVETQADQRVSVIERMFKQFWTLPVNYYHSKYPNDPQMFGEIGTRNTDGYVLGPDYFYSIPKSQRELDEQERADAIYAMLKASKELGINALDLWTIPLGDLWGGNTWKNNFLTIGLRNPISPAYRVIKAIIGPAPSQAKTQPASSSN